MQLYKIWAVFVLSITSVGRDQYCQYPPVQWQKSCYYYQQVYFSMGLCSGLEKSTWSTAQEMIHSPPYRFRCGLDRNLATIMKKCVVQYIHSSEKVHKHSYILIKEQLQTKTKCKLISAYCFWRRKNTSLNCFRINKLEKSQNWTQNKNLYQLMSCSVRGCRKHDLYHWWNLISWWLSCLL